MFKGKKYVDSQKLLEKSKLYDGAEAKFTSVWVLTLVTPTSRFAALSFFLTVQVRRFAFLFSLRATRLQLLKKQALNM